ncbi:MAG: hypothetical protein IH987_18235 [Planctomycetes bacterium]|nr:hypothetical protein [Planctomycetota bacterium]
MIDDNSKYELIETLARKCPNRMGRTALMKFMYFLQTLRNVPLGYRFSLHSYGPFDSDVLSDLGEAELLGYVNSEVKDYPGGYGYEIKDTEPPSKSEFLDEHEDDIGWVIDEFGSDKSADLELSSTIVFADREERPCSQSTEDLASLVHQVKPHFSKARIIQRIERLEEKGILGQRKGNKSN